MSETTNPTPEELRASIVPKSDQLNADDLLTGPITVTIENVRKGDKEQPVFVDISGYPGRPYKPCKTMRRILIAQFSDNPKEWIGKQMTLYRDPNVMWGGLKYGGIRISHLSGLDQPKTFLLTQTRGKKAEITIKPLKADRLTKFRAWLKSKELSDSDAMAAINGKPLESATDAEWEALRQWAKDTEKVKDQ